MPWSHSYSNVRLIRGGPAFDVLRATDTDGQPRVPVVANGVLPDPAAREVLARPRRAHAAIRHPWVPRATAATSLGGVDLVHLECDACLDMPQVMSRMVESGTRLDYGRAELETYKNPNDPSDNHVALVTSAAPGRHLAVAEATGDLNGGKPWMVVIAWSAEEAMPWRERRARR